MKRGRRNYQKVQDQHSYEIDLNNIDRMGKTTIMIRNIPNKYTKNQMLHAINENFRGQFNFFYLPIDFVNNCNVGYAFINFLDVKSIKPFYKKFNGKKWKKFNSDKICKINYARI